MQKNLFKAVVISIATFIGIGLGFYYLSDTAEHMAMICYVSIAGFLTAYLEYLHYKQSKKVTRWEQ
jgi:multidrug transporter EmrE-like cation transporter